MSNSDSMKKWKHGPDAPVGSASSAFLETPAEFLINSQVRGIGKRIVHDDDNKTPVVMTSIL